MRNRLVLAIDPGSVSGAYALLAYNVGVPGLGPTIEVLAVDDLPVMEKNVNGPAFARIVRDAEKYTNTRFEAVTERVSAMPKQGISSAFNFGRGLGIIEGVLSALLVPTTFVSPAKWKGAMGLNRDGEASRTLATRLYPEQAGALRRVKDHNRAEAILLGHYHIGGWRP